MQAQAVFHDRIARFPKEAADILSSLVSQAARLDSSQIDALTSCLGFPRGELMKKLLPLAAALGVTPVSHFNVGAVAEGGSGNIYLGTNLEFLQHPLKVQFTLNSLLLPMPGIRVKPDYNACWWMRHLVVTVVSLSMN